MAGLHAERIRRLSMGFIDWVATGEWNKDYSNQNVVMRAGEPVSAEELANLAPSAPPGGYGPDLETAIKAAQNKIWKNIPLPGFGISFTTIAIIALAIVALIFFGRK